MSSILLIDCSLPSLLHFFINAEVKEIGVYKNQVGRFVLEKITKSFEIVRQKINIDYATCVFDDTPPSARDKIYINHFKKSYRQLSLPLDEFEPLRELAAALGWHVLNSHKAPATSAIFVLARTAANLGLDVVIVSADRITSSLISPKISIYNPVSGCVSKFSSIEKRELPADLIFDYLLLTDELSKIPGFKNYSDRAAKKLLTSIGSINHIAAHEFQETNKNLQKAQIASTQLLKLKKCILRTPNNKVLKNLQKNDFQTLCIKPQDSVLFDAFVRRNLLIEYISSSLQNQTKNWIDSQKTFNKYMPTNRHRIDYNFITYRIRNKINNNVYFGSSGNINRRKTEHLRDLKNGTHPNPNLKRDAEIYGVDAFEFKILGRYSNSRDMLAHEQLLISMFYGRKNCYNHQQFVPIQDGLSFCLVIHVSEKSNSNFKLGNLAIHSAHTKFEIFISAHAVAKRFCIPKSDVLNALKSFPSVVFGRIFHTSAVTNPNLPKA